MLNKKQSEAQVSATRQKEVGALKVKDTKLVFREGATFTISGWTTIIRGETEVTVFITSLGYLNIEPREESRHYLADGQTKYRPEGDLDKQVQKARANDEATLENAYGKIITWAKGQEFICRYKRIETDNGKKSVLCVYSNGTAPTRKPSK